MSAVALAAGSLIYGVPASANDVATAAADAPTRPFSKTGASPSKLPAGVRLDHEEIDTEHIFGFSMGSDIGHPGEIEVEFENVGAFGKRAGTYAAVANLSQVKYTVSDRLRVAPGFAFSGQRINGVPGWADHQNLSFSGAGFELRYKLIDRSVAPFGLTLHAQPSWSRIDDASGLRIEQYGAEFAALFDRELIEDRLFAAFNVWYGLGGTREAATNLWRHESEFQLQGAVSYAVQPSFLLGVGLRYVRAYDGSGLDRFTGDAVFAGPTFSTTLANNIGLSGTWQTQIAGRANGDGRRLNLEQFERHQAMLRLNLHY